MLPISVDAQKGCCSHHGGVSGGCSSSGKQICNDGTLSPTCTCTPSVSYKYGCTDKIANNYNDKAKKDDGSCKYNSNLSNKSNNVKEENSLNNDDEVDTLGTITGLGMLGGIIYLIAKKKK